MELTTKEQFELDALRKNIGSGLILSKKQTKRHKYLVNKEMHKKCPNPKCLVQGGSKDIYCPDCKTKLFNLI